MSIAVLFPAREYSSIAERYASWQAQLQLRRSGVSEIAYYDENEPAEDAVARLKKPYLLVVVDPLIVVDENLVPRLRSAYEQQQPAAIVLPAQSGLPLYFCDAGMLRGERRSLRHAVQDRESRTVEGVVVRSWQRPPAPDLLPFIPTAARSFLHLACGDGLLGEQVKRRQRCRAVGIERRRDEVLAAKKRLDDVYLGEIVQIVSIVSEEFDCIATAGTIEQIEDPWSFVTDLRRIATPDGTLVATLPNVANERTIADLREGRFPVAEQLRFFTRESIRDLIEIAGWQIEHLESVTALGERFVIVARNR